MKLSPREVAMGLATQAESLPRLRDKLLGIVNEINLVLNDGKARGHSAPRKTSKAAAGRMGGLAVQAAHRKKKQPKGKFVAKLPSAAVNIRGVHKDYHFVPGVGVISLTKTGRFRLLITPRSSGGAWTVRKPSGERFFLTRGRLTKGTGLEVSI
jgi:hypothetical protein